MRLLSRNAAVLLSRSEEAFDDNNTAAFDRAGKSQRSQALHSDAGINGQMAGVLACFRSAPHSACSSIAIWICRCLTTAHCRYWCQGSKRKAGQLIVYLIVHLRLVAYVQEALHDIA